MGSSSPLVKDHCLTLIFWKKPPQSGGFFMGLDSPGNRPPARRPAGRPYSERHPKPVHTGGGPKKIEKTLMKTIREGSENSPALLISLMNFGKQAPRNPSKPLNKVRFGKRFSARSTKNERPVSQAPRGYHAPATIAGRTKAYIGGDRFVRDLAVLKDNKFLIYCGAPLACAAVALPILPSAAAFCVDNRVMCAPLAPPMADEPGGNEAQPLYARGPLTVIASTGTLSVPRYATATTKL
jgi:hypothetical protein